MKTAKKRLQLVAGEHPAIFSALYRLKGETRAVTPTTQLVIEGFPRSANTFSVWAFKQAQGEEVGNVIHVAHHLHYPAQVIRAAQWGIPALVLLRNPEDAVTSWVIRNPQPLDRALRHYISFYKSVARYRDAWVLGLFEEVTQDYGAVIEQINDRFGTQFSPFHHTKENVEKVFSYVEDVHRTRNGGRILENRIARPSTTRASLRQRIRPDLQTAKHKRLLAEAETIYAYLAN